MCKCFEEKLVLIKEHVSKKLTDFEKSYLQTEWEGYSFFMDGGDHIPVNPKVKIEYRTQKKNGDIQKSKKKDSVSMLARYCPFCGRDTKEDKDQNEPSTI